MGPRKCRYSNCRRILVPRYGNYLLRSSSEACVDDFVAAIAQGSRDDFSAAIVAVETGFCDDYSHALRFNV